MIPQANWITISARQSRGTQVCQSPRAVGRRSQEIVYNDFEWPRFEQIQADADQRQKQAEYRFSPERLVIAKDAPVNRHVNLVLRVSDLDWKRSNFIAVRDPKILRVRSK